MMCELQLLTRKQLRVQDNEKPQHDSEPLKNAAWNHLVT